MLRATKRKLDDAFHSLDNAVGSSESLSTNEQPPPLKKAHTARSLYSTLAKYGIKTKSKPDTSKTTPLASLSKSTPHLTAILSRAATRTRAAFPFKFTAPPTPLAPSPAEYRPSSIPSFLSRLATFKLATYANKPPAVDAVAAAKCGWVNDGKDRLVCGLCGVSWVLAGREGLGRDAANALIEKQRVGLVECHKDGCPWKTRQCDPSIYRIPLQAPIVMVRDLKFSAMALDPLLEGVQIKHPLTSGQLNSLRSTISSFALPPTTLTPVAETTPNQTPDSTQIHDVFTAPPSAPKPSPSETAILAALFGWSLVPPAPAPKPDSASRRSVSRSASVLATSRPATPSLSRATSVAGSRAGTPSGDRIFRIPSGASAAGKRDTSLLHCVLCQRRVGLWAFAPPVEPKAAPEPLATPSTAADGEGPSTPAPVRKESVLVGAQQRAFDLLKEHRSYCPYVVRSTVVPSLPVPASGLKSASTSSFGASIGTSAFSRLARSGSSLGGTGAGAGGSGSGGTALEGWRAVLSMVTRYGAGRRQRAGLDYAQLNVGMSGEAGGAGPKEGANVNADAMEVDDDVKAMVEGVKSHGGRDLLRYVKGLLS
ncbi:C3HC zinc finger-like-domain-containing protein [Infundibulicybe gibba]|nr:C3HC zinc finger-like-domain-containing protein [Infundibulicybe gibba]